MVSLYETIILTGITYLATNEHDLPNETCGIIKKNWRSINLKQLGRPPVTLIHDELD